MSAATQREAIEASITFNERARDRAAHDAAHYTEVIKNLRRELDALLKDPDWGPDVYALDVVLSWHESGFIAGHNFTAHKRIIRAIGGLPGVQTWCVARDIGRPVANMKWEELTAHWNKQGVTEVIVRPPKVNGGYTYKLEPH